MSDIPLYGGLHSQFMLLGLTGPNSGPILSPLVTSRSRNRALFASEYQDIPGAQGLPGITGPTGPFTVFTPGMIMMFNSATAPTGWLLCDGTSGTPDLRGQFVMQQYSAATFDFGETGGTSSVTLALNQMPAHTHTFDTHNGISQGGAGTLGAGSGGSPSGATEASTSAGSATSFSNLPPYYVLTFIMKS
jgi:microcystin-dependent protein